MEKHIKNLRINAEKIKTTTACILTAGVTAGMFKVIGLGFPFYLDNVKIDKYNVERIKQDKVVEYDTSYSKSDNILIHYGKWEQEINGNYKRKFEIYKIKDIDKEKIINMVKNSKNVSLDKVLGKPFTTGIQNKSGLVDSKELQQNGYMEAIIYSEKTNDYIVCKESVSENVIETLAYILFTTLLEQFPIHRYKTKTKKKIENSSI